MDNRNDTLQHGQSPDRAFLFSHLQTPGTVLLESSRQDPQNKKHFLFYSPVEILTAYQLEEIPDLFVRIEQHRAQGHWIAGYVAYECGYHFDTILPSYTNSGSLPLVWFGVYTAPTEAGSRILDEIAAEKLDDVMNPLLSIGKDEYHATVHTLKNYIADGDTYQVNFTDRFEFSFKNDPRDLYFSLRRKQHVPFGAFLNLGSAQILSFSPELFFRREGSSIITKPMKGTYRRGRNSEEDQRFSNWLKNDEKNRSENLMIVDLLRNDIGRICEIGSVEVKDMYAIERYETVLQMTSTVTGRLMSGVSYYEIFRALFPCGSVTGAPKIRTMQIINKLERLPRGVYCGAIGYIAPDDRSVFNVAIRTVTISDQHGVMGVGSGIVYDSEPEIEYDECRLKGAFLLNEQPEFQLFETILWNREYTFLDRHLERMSGSAEYFQIPYLAEVIKDVLRAAERTFQQNILYRVRVLLSRTGIPTLEAKEYSLPLTSIIKIAEERTDSSNIFLYHKTTNRTLYEKYRKKATEEGIADYLFLNERNEITEGSISNIFVENKRLLSTPPVHSGVLPGVFRNEVLRTNSLVAEKIINIDDLRKADALYLCNSLRGWSKVTLSE
ncbi:MAG: aminodeoxychorismate synthase component I [Bacteriovoracaceae bacterium]